MILRMLNGCSVLVARKLLQSATNEPDELKVITHLNIDKSRFSSLYVVK